MGYWRKSFADGGTLRGTDEDVAKRLASWSKSRLTGMTGALIEHDNHLIEIVGIGDFWQADTYETSLLSSQSRLINRRIQKRIASHDLCFYMASNLNSLRVSFATNLIQGKYQQISAVWVGKWFTLEYNIHAKSMRYFISSERL